MISFDELLAPCTRQSFFETYWEEKPLVIRQARDKFKDLPNLQYLPSMLSGNLTERNWIKGYLGVAYASLLSSDGSIKRLVAHPNMWADFYNAGFSLCFSAVDAYHQRLRDLLSEVAKTTPFSGRNTLTCYLTPPFAGSEMHFDSQNVILLQRSGRKIWQVGTRAGWKQPPTNLTAASLDSSAVQAFTKELGVTVARPEEMDFEELVLDEGDALYMPAGFWHRGSTTEMHSFHYTLTFVPFTPWEILLPVVRDVALRATTMRDDLRFCDATRRDSREAHLATALNALKARLEELNPEALLDFYDKAVKGNGLLNGYILQP